MAYNSFPYTDFHELNLDYLLNKSKEIEGNVTETAENVERATQQADRATQQANASSSSAGASAQSAMASAQSASASAQSAQASAQSAEEARAAAGDPKTFTAAAQLTDTTKIYVYVGETGTYTYGHYYYYQGGSWHDGGVYGTWATDDALSDTSTNAVQNKVVNAAVSELKSELNNAKNLGGLNWQIGTLVPETGIESSSTTRIRSPFIPVIGGEIVELSGTANCLIVYCYNANRDFISASAWTDGNIFHVPTGTGNIRILIRKDSSNTTISTDEVDTLAEQCTLRQVLPANIYDFDHEIDKLENEIDKRPIKEYFNRFDTSQITSGKYLSTATGNLATGTQFFTSDFIEIGDLSTVKCSYTHIICWYDSNKTFINSPSEMNSINNDITLTPPLNAAYLRFSTYNEYLNTAQVGKDISRNLYIQYGYYAQPGLVIAKDNAERIITVAADGSGNYTSLTKALYDNVDTGIDIIVKPGTYNIASEYIALFGQSAVDSMADSDSAIFNGFQYGAIIRNRKIEFAPGAKVVCDWTGHSVDGTHRFSALRVDYNCEIIGLYLDCTATFYCIHDDYGLVNIPYTVKYENCRVFGHSIYNANCIGGGCKKYSKHILKNCYLDNDLTGQTNATVRYHNTNAEGAEPEIYVSNCYFSNSFQPRYYGTQTSKMKVYVNNCEARAIFKMAESSSFTTDNVDLYKWCNTETNPVT